MRFPNPLLPTVPVGLHVEGLALDPAGLLITASPIAAAASCPVCGRPSTRIHSRYWRTLKDLPWQDRAVTWRIRVRRFRCDDCPGRVFAERLEGLTGAKSRRSGRLAKAQTDIGMALGGEAGARLSSRLAMPVSGDTVLRPIRRCPTPPCPAPSVVGIDDWVWRRGRRYGTIVCDLERRRVIDLLPSRSGEPVRDWLAAHPGVTVVSRDRAGPYAEAARSGAPAAIQVADRWHLLVNASDALRGVVERHPRQLQEAARLCISPPSMRTAPVPSRRRARDGRRRARFEVVVRLRTEGVSIKEIVRRTGVARNAVRRWLRAGEFAPYRRAPGASLLDRHLSFVEERWAAGLRNCVDLHRALGAEGFEGGYDIVRRWAVRRRRAEAGADARPPSARVPSTRRTTRLLTGDPASLGEVDAAFVDALRAAAPEVRAAADLARAFGELVRRRDPTALEPWLEAAAATGLRGFATGVRQDKEAVRAAITQPWSNGPVEGHITRLKLIKRQMFGRAKFDLLRKRVLCAA